MKDCDSIGQLAWKIPGSILNKYKTVYIVCDLYKIISIKSGEPMLRGDGKVYMIKTPDMKLPYDMTTFLQYGRNKELLFNLIERPIVEDRNKLNKRVVFFSKKEHFFKISSDHVLQVPEKSSDHKEADTKLIALVESAKVNGNNVMARSPSGDIDILVLFILHQYEGKNVFIDNRVEKN